MLKGLNMKGIRTSVRKNIPCYYNPHYTRHFCVFRKTDFSYGCQNVSAVPEIWADSTGFNCLIPLSHDSVCKTYHATQSTVHLFFRVVNTDFLSFFSQTRSGEAKHVRRKMCVLIPFDTDRHTRYSPLPVCGRDCATVRFPSIRGHSCSRFIQDISPLLSDRMSV